MSTEYGFKPKQSYCIEIYDSKITVTGCIFNVDDRLRSIKFNFHIVYTSMSF